jgi:hypothetical protein
MCFATADGGKIGNADRSSPSWALHIASTLLIPLNVFKIASMYGVLFGLILFSRPKEQFDPKFLFQNKSWYS